MSGEAIDLGALRRLLNVIGGEREDLQELIDDFIDTAPTLVSKMRAASDAGDWDALRIAAHTLKSNARDFGAVRLAELCEVLERECRTGEVSKPNDHCIAIEAEEAIARAALSGLSAEDV